MIPLPTAFSSRAITPRPRLSLTEFSTPRLRLVPAAVSHAASVRTYLLENQNYLQPWEPLRHAAFFEPYAVAERLQAMAQRNINEDALHLLMFGPDSDELIGVCNFTNVVRGAFQACHLGYSIAQRCQGQGLMHEGLAAAIAHVFQNMKLHRIMANYRPENTRSARLLSRLGFQREGEARSYLQINGAWCDHVLTALINSADR
ncbi:ribosomal protein S5-alanine N-acetyltransferase [Achromobacter marplatensis]|uniref:ribosomal protein S5-alanine N-acetyltransferase n=1 Tax=Achromobacter marplatensis TaxID=470868 RepID=UPI0039F6BF13